MIKCDPRAKAKCPFKNPCCGDEVAYFTEGSDCDKFNQEVLSPPPTNADRIRAMSDEELAVWLCGITDCSLESCPGAHLCTDGGGRANGIVEWLKQPYKEE